MNQEELSIYKNAKDYDQLPKSGTQVMAITLLKPEEVEVANSRYVTVLFTLHGVDYRVPAPSTHTISAEAVVRRNSQGELLGAKTVAGGQQ